MLKIFLGLKTYSNWPTYPQLYVKGELIGGLDIVKELIESGEFDSMVPKKQNLDDRLVSFCLFSANLLDQSRCAHIPNQLARLPDFTAMKQMAAGY